MPSPSLKSPQWSPRVPKWKIAHVYEDDARGMHDAELIDEVAFTLFARCRSMLAVGEARLGRAVCPACDAIVEHAAVKGCTMVCGACGWNGAWDAYRASFDGRHLIAPGILPFCRQYTERMPLADAPKAKVYWIDWLIHRVHWEGTALPGQPGAVCLIEGRAHDVNAFLDDLSGTKSVDEGPDAAGEAGDTGDLSLLWSDEQLARSEKWRARAERRRKLP